MKAEKSFYMVKRCYEVIGPYQVDYVWVVLRVPPGAAVRKDINKTRVSRAEVVAIYDNEGNPRQTARATTDLKFIYELGQVVRPREAFARHGGACGSGIHGVELHQLPMKGSRGEGGWNWLSRKLMCPRDEPPTGLVLALYDALTMEELEATDRG
jgi:hypothetical protein